MAYRSFIGTAFGLGTESTLGTAVSRTVWNIPMSVSGFVEQYDYRAVETLSQGLGAGPGLAHYRRYNNTVSGTLTIPFMYDGLGMVLESMQLNSVANSGAGPYAHNYEQGGTITGRTMELIRGDSGNSEIFAGCVVPRWRMVCRQGREVVLEVDWIAFKASADRTTAGTPTFSSFADMATNIVAAQDSAVMSWNSGTYAINTSWTLEVDNGIEPVRATSNRNIEGFVRSRNSTSRLTISRIEDADTLYNNFRKDDVSGEDLTIAFTGSGNLAAQVLLRNAKPVGYPAQGISQGGIAEQVVFVGLQDATDSALRIQVTNDSSSGTAN